MDKDALESVQQRFLISADEKGTFLTVYPASAGNAPVNEAEIIETLRAQGITNVQLPLITRTIKEAAGSPVNILPPQSQVEPDIQVLVERDRMEAFVIITMAANSKQPTPEQVVEKLKASGVCYGIKLESLKRACQQSGIKISVAAGLRPQDGANARIDYLFSLDHKAKPAVNQDGSVDHKDINLFTTVRSGELLAEKKTAEPGTPGMDVLGNSIPAKPGKDVPLPFGKNVRVDGNKIVADIAGQVMLVNNKIHVNPVIMINGDIDFSSGNIDFIGNVMVKGSVQPGFSIKAEGDIEIQGSINDGIVEGRNVIVRTGIQGKRRGHVTAKQNVHAKFIENSTVLAEGDVYVSDVILHSRVSAKHKVVVEGRRGMIVGGQVTAGEEIKAKIAGTQLAISTELVVGINPALREEYQVLRKSIHQVEENRDQVQKSLQALRALEPSGLSPERKELLLKLTKAQFQLAGQVETMHERIVEIEAELDQMRQGRIRIADTVYPGVKVVVGTHVKSVRENLRYVTFQVEDGELTTGAYY